MWLRALLSDRTGEHEEPSGRFTLAERMSPWTSGWQEIVVAAAVVPQVDHELLDVVRVHA